MNSDVLFDYFGHFGLYQFLVFLLARYYWLFDGTLAYNYIAYRVDYRCDIPELAHLPAGNQSFIASPFDGEEYDQCNIFDRNYANLTAEDMFTRSEDYQTKKCQSWIYDQSEYTRTIVSEFDLVCGKSNLVPLPATIEFAGQAVGTFLTGIFSDRFGRKRTLSVLLCIYTVGGTLAAVSPYYWVFCVGKFLMGLTLNSIYVSGHVITMEIIGQKYRGYMGFAFPLSGVLFAFTTPALGYFVRDYKWIQGIQFMNMSFHILLVLFLMPEPPRWLIQNGRLKEAEAVLRRMAKINKKTVPENLDKILQEIRDNELKLTANQQKKKTVIDLYSSKVLRRRALAINLHWFVDSLMYYAMNLNVSSLFGNIYINVMLLRLVELPAVILGALAINWRYTGRRFTTSFAMILAGVSSFILMIMLIMNVEGGSLTAMALTGKAFITIAFHGIYIYTSETFPTEVRHVGIGTASLFARISGMIAPYMGPPMEEIWKPLPSLIFGVVAFIGGSFILTLPETLGTPMCQTIEEAEKRTVKGYKALLKQQERIDDMQVKEEGNENPAFTQTQPSSESKTRL